MGDVQVFFVTQSQSEPSDAWNKAAKALKEMEVELNWLNEEDCFKVVEKKRNQIYVFENFEGKAFEHILSSKNRIYGPMCLLNCVENSEAMRPMPHPVYSLALKGMVISCTSIPLESREKLHRQIQWMHGEVCKDFHQGVTHLIAGEVGSKKYMVAANLKKKIMSTEWVTEVWKASGNSFVRGDDPKYDKLRCPIFKGLVVTVSGLDTTERNDIKEIINKEGGRYTGEMKINECTHLIVKQPRGQKYEYGRRWKICIISPQWVFSSLEASSCLPEQDFDVMPAANGQEQAEDEKQNTSTPNKKRTARLSELSDVSTISVTHINDTALNQTVNQSYAPFASVPRRSHAAAAPPDPLDDMDVSIAPPDMFLDGCKIYMSGFVGAKLDKLRRIINLGGGTRFNQINENVTHVIVGQTVEEDVKILQKGDFRPHVVRVDWLLESYKQGQCLPEETYTCLSLNAFDPSSPLTKSMTKKSTKDSNKSRKSEIKEPPKRAVSEAEPAGNDMDDLLSQYLPADDESALARAAEEASQQQLKIGNNQTVTNASTANTTVTDPDATQDPNDQTTLVEPLDGEVLAGKSFVVLGFAIDDEKELVSYIKENGGKVLPARTRVVPDFAIVPLFGCRVDMAAGEIVTNAWLQMSLESEKLLPVESNELFSPLSTPHGATPLTDCVLSISGYGGTERDVLMHIAELLGAKCQEYFVKKATKHFEPNTHLVVNSPGSSKYNAALKWSLPAVSKGWLFECARTGKRASEDRFLIQKLVEEPPPEVQEVKVKEPKESVHSKAVDDSKEGETSRTTRSKRNQQKLPEPGPAKKRAASIAEQAEKLSRNKSESSDDEIKPVNTARVQKESTPVRDPEPKLKSGRRPRSYDLGESESDSDEDLDTSNKENDETVDLVEKPETPATVQKVKTEDKTRIKSSHNITPAAVNHRVMQLREGKSKSTSTPGVSPSSKLGIESPSQFLVPGKTYRPTFDVADFLDGLPSPATPFTPGGKHKRKPSLPLEDLYAAQIAIAVENTKKLQSNKEHVMVSDDEDCAAESILLRQEKPTGPLHGVIIAVSKKLSSHQSEFNQMVKALGGDFRWTYDDSCTHYVFQGKKNDMNKEFRKARGSGKKVVCPHWLNTCKEQNTWVEESHYPHTYNHSMSLSVLSSQTPIARRSSRLRRTRRGGNDSSPVRHSDEAGHHSAEEKMDSSPEPPAPQRLFTRDMDTTQSDEEIARACEDAEEKEVHEQDETLLRGLKDLVASTETYANEKRRKSRRNESFDKVLTANSSGGKRSRPSSRNTERHSSGSNRKAQTYRGSRSRTAEVQDTEPTQVCEVGWDDPGARAECEMMAPALAQEREPMIAQREMMAPALAQESEPMTSPENLNHSRLQRSFSDEDTALEDHIDLAIKKSVPRRQRSITEDRVPTPEAPSLAFPLPKPPGPVSPPRPVQPIHNTSTDPDETLDIGEEEQPTIERIFLLSGMTQQEKTDYGALVESLGGVMLDAAHYDAKCTHLVVGNPSRNEKYLACVASGKWVLHKSYFEACREEGSFVQEDSHEWGGDGMASMLGSLPAQVTKLAQSANRWRCKLQSQQKDNGAFSGWVVMLLTDKNREDGFRRLLQAGGATVLSAKPPFKELDTVTHAFIDLSKITIQIDLAEFVQKDVHCLKPEYIAAFLMDNPPPQRHKYVLSEARALSGRSSSQKRKASEDLGTSTKRRC